MDVEAFSAELLRALAASGIFDAVSLQTEGPVAKGRAQAGEGLFLRFYFNEITGTLAFALIRGEDRIWGLDHDSLRDWHLHPASAPSTHVPVEPVSVTEIVTRLREVIVGMVPE
jgi:hypothetical protein